ncbi:hypothetical protein ACFYP4_02965 [Streptomyces sp. NPDC005551]|uniref:hypothetical protein n=1 Tax=Streptomyces sp. NPDC005551 TaxID=3364725 RepID=UPI003680585E
MSAQADLDAAISYIKQRGIPIGRIMAVVNAARRLDAELLRGMEAGVVHMSGQRVSSVDLMADLIEQQVAESKRGRKFLEHKA